MRCIIIGIVLEKIDPRIKPPCDREDAMTVLERLRGAGQIAYFAGGCVRDMLLGRAPKDYDIATDAPPQRVRELFSNTQAVGAAFGVILVRLNRSVIEIATFRADGAYSDGRRPDTIQFTNAQEDAQRRDFTINGLFLDPIENKVIDYVGGQADLQNHVLRAIGNPADRFNEDHLRLLRAIRFAARFSFTIESATAVAIRSAAPRLKGISPERIGDELRLMLPPATRAAAWKLLWEFRLAAELFRFLSIPGDFSLQFDRSLFMQIAPLPVISFGFALAVMTLDVRLQVNPPRDVVAFLEKKEVQRSVAAMRQALRISNDESEEMAEILLGIAPLLAARPPTLAGRRRFLSRPTAAQSRVLLSLLAARSIRAERISELLAQFVPLDSLDNNPAPLLTGDDLVAIGFQPSRAFKLILDRVYDAQLESAIASKDQAIVLARQLNQADASAQPAPGYNRPHDSNDP